MNPKKFIRKSFPVEAEQVTVANMHDVAEWSGGTIVEGDEKGLYIYIDVENALADKPDQKKAYVGKWVLKSEKGKFKVYTDNAFRSHFLAANEG